jgi:hypothetical protein
LLWIAPAPTESWASSRKARPLMCIAPTSNRPLRFERRLTVAECFSVPHGKLRQAG